MQFTGTEVVCQIYNGWYNVGAQTEDNNIEYKAIKKICENSLDTVVFLV